MPFTVVRELEGAGVVAVSPTGICLDSHPFSKKDLSPLYKLPSIEYDLEDINTAIEDLKNTRIVRALIKTC